MKSGIMSMGLIVEKTVRTMIAFAYQGIRGSLRAVRVLRDRSLSPLHDV